MITKMKNLLPSLLTIVLCIQIAGCSNKSSDSKNNGASGSGSGIWHIVEIRDNAGKVVPGKSAIMATIKGRMSNNSTPDAELTVKMQIQDSTIVTQFYEYKNQLEARLPDKGFFSAVIKLSDGRLTKAKQFFYKNMMVDDDKDLFFLLLSQKNPIKIIVELGRFNKQENSVYSYEIDPAGLADLLKKNK
jgi:hypothetical protein